MRETIVIAIDCVPAGLIDLDGHRSVSIAAAIAGAAHRGGAEIVEPDGDAGMGVGGADAVGGIEADPAEIGHIGFRPGVAGLLVDHAVGAQEMAGDEARGNAAVARAGDEDMRVVLADAALSAKASAAEVPLLVGSSSNVMCSLICTISACRKPSTSSSDSARSSRANAAIAGLTAVSAVERRNRLGGKRSSVPRSTPPVSWVSIRPSTCDGEIGDRPVGQHMGDVAEGVLMRVEPGVGGDVDLPFRDILPVMAAGRHAQDLDHAGGRRLVAIAGGMGNSQAHGRNVVSVQLGYREFVMPGLVPGIHVFLLRTRKTWMAGTGPAMTHGVSGIRSNTAW